MNYPKYEAYKDSGVEWLGDIPESWELLKLKRSVNGCINGLWGNDPKANDNDIVVLRVADFDREKLVINNSKLTFRNINKQERKSRLLKQGDLLIEKSGGGEKTLVGCVVLFNEKYEAVSSNFVGKMTPNRSINSIFLKYVFSTLYANNINYPSIKQTTGIQNLDIDSYLDEKFCFPKFNDQKTIANFLDQKTAQIDQAIAIKEQQIALLNERKQIVIQQAVTKGLDPNVNMKDSGVEWIGQIPEHWEVRKVKHLFKLIIEPAPKNNEYELLSVYTDIGVKPRKELEERGNKASTTDGYWMVKKGDIIVNKLLAWMGAIGLSNYDGVTSPAYDILRPTVELNPYLYHILFRSPSCSQELKKHSRGIMEMRLRLYFDKFGDVLVPFAPVDEQHQIIEFIQAKEIELNAGKALLEQQIQKLKEYKTTLINDAVTGKIKVV